MNNYSIKYEKSRDNKDILIINDKYIHSRFSPAREADNFKLSSRHLVLIFGAGFAYHINNIIKNNSDSFFIIFEPCKEIFESCMDYIEADLKEKYNNKICLLNSFEDNTLYDFFNKNYTVIIDLRITGYSNPGYKKLFPELEITFLNAVKKMHEIIVQNVLTESNFIPLWTKNFLINSKNLPKYPLIHINNMKLNDNLAVICSAGPGLLNDLNIIKKFRDKITIFTVDTALKPLINNDIYPDFIISLDGQYYSIDDFVNNIPGNPLCLVDIITYPGVSGICKNIMYTVSESILNRSIIEYFYKYFKINLNAIDSGGTVSDYALNLAVSFGFTNIYFAGLDLSFPYLLSHCNGTPFHNRALNLSDYFNTPQSIILKTISLRNLKLTESRDHGKMVYSDFVLQNYAFYFKNYAEKNPGIKLYYNPYSGININGINKILLETLVADLDTTNIKWNKLINHDCNIYIDKANIKEFLNQFKNLIYQYTRMINTLFETADFTKPESVDTDRCLVIYNMITKEFPFIEKFILMSKIILNKKNITIDHAIWFKHIFHKILQSLYFLFRITTKVLKSFD